MYSELYLRNCNYITACSVCKYTHFVSLKRVFLIGVMSKADIALLPRLAQNCSLVDFKCWKNEFMTFVDLVVDELDYNDKGIKYLRYAIASAKLFIEIDGRSTLKTAVNKVQEHFLVANRPAFPLMEFYALKWIDFSGTVMAYIESLKSRLFFITDNAAKEQLVAQHLLEQLSPELRMVMADNNLQDMVTRLTRVPKEQALATTCPKENIQIPISATLDDKFRTKVRCFNCATLGHVSSGCSQKKRLCQGCNKWGHQAQFCSRRSKNWQGAALLAEQGGQTTKGQHINK